MFNQSKSEGDSFVSESHLVPDLSAPYWRVQISDDETCVVLTPDGSSYVIRISDFELFMKKKGFDDPVQVTNYLWNFKSIRVDFKRMRFDVVSFIENQS